MSPLLPRNSVGLMVDMDLVVLIDDENAGLDPSHLVQMMGDLLERVSCQDSLGGIKADDTGNKLCR